MRTSRGYLLFLAALLVSPVAWSQTTSGPVATTPADRPINPAAQSSAGETLRACTQLVDLSRIAADRAVHPAVKAHARDAAEAINGLHEELKGLVPAVAHAPRNRRENVFDDRGWQTKKAEDFDRDYLKEAVKLYEETGELLDTLAGGEHEDLQSFAERHRPTLASHQEQASTLLEQAN